MCVCVCVSVCVRAAINGSDTSGKSIHTYTLRDGLVRSIVWGLSKTDTV